MAFGNDTILLERLTASYLRQLGYYTDLRDAVRGILSRLVLSQGDLSRLAENLERKRELLAAIEAERGRIAGEIEEWQQRKALISRDGAVDRFNEILERVTDAIRGFLDDEKQLQNYLSGILSRAPG